MSNSVGFTTLAKATAACLFSLIPGYALASNLVTNGSFETGTTAGWTVSGGTCAWQSLTAGSSTSQAGAFVAPTPTDGTHVLLSDAPMIETCTFQQDVNLPGGTTDTLTLDAGYNFQNFGNPMATGAGCSASVAVTTTGGVPIATAYSAAGGTNQALGPRPPVNLTAQAGSTVRILVSTASCDDGPAGVILDNVVINSNSAANVAVPTLTEWGLVLLGLLLATAGALFIRRDSEA